MNLTSRTFTDDNQEEDISVNDNFLKEGKVGNHGLGYQEEVGVFKSIEVPHHALTISEGWPSWSFAIEGLGFKSITTLAYFESINSRDEFLATSLGGTLINKLHLNSFLTEHNDDLIIFVQGNISFFSNAYKVIIKRIPCPQLAYVCTDQSFHSGDGFRLSHKDTGGVTDGTWTVYLEGLKNVTIPKTSVLRNLGHLLRTTESQSSSRSLLA